MALRGLILLAVLGLGSGADNFKFTDCKKMPDGVTAKDPMKSSAYQMSAGAPNNGSIEVTVTTGTLKFFRIVAMEDQKDTMPKGMFMLPPDPRAMLMNCDTMTNAAVVNKDPAVNVTAPFTVMWKAMPDYEGRLRFRLVVVESAEKYYMAESGVQAVTKMHPSDGGNGHKNAGDGGKDAHTKATASLPGLSAWLVTAALGLVVVPGLRHNLPIS
uniref:Reelin domain-containing protein n=1 Tax=Rhipicephalus appendiculatus TaxID=34631 RepID=A0A131YEB5_RHIAP